MKRTPGESGRRLALDGLRLQLAGLFRQPEEGGIMVFSVRYVDGTEEIYRTSPVTGVDPL